MSTQAINSGAGTTVKGIKTVHRYIKKEAAANGKALNTAVRVESFRLSRLMKSDIRKGSPGGRTLAPLSFIARRMQRKVHGGGGGGIRQSPNRKPLARLALAVRYAVASVAPFAMKVGFVDHGGSINKVSNTWRRIAKLQQEGFTRPVTAAQRRAMVERGGELGTVEGGATPFFLRGSKNRFITPARPIVKPFWSANKFAAARNIKTNFRLKMAGKRI